MGVAFAFVVLGPQLYEGRVIHAGARCPAAPGQAQAGTGRAGLLLFLLKDVTQGTVARTNGLLQSGAQEAVGGPGTVTWDEL